MTKEEFKIYRKETLDKIERYRKFIEEYPDVILLKLQILRKYNSNLYEKYEDDGHFFTVDERYFFYVISKELFCIIDHLEETGEWRIPCAVRHFDDLLYFVKN